MDDLRIINEGKLTCKTKKGKDKEGERTREERRIRTRAGWYKEIS